MRSVGVVPLQVLHYILVLLALIGESIGMKHVGSHVLALFLGHFAWFLCIQTRTGKHA